MQNTQVPDMTQRFPDAGEPEEEREYIVSAWVPMMVEVRAYGSSREEAIRHAKKELKNVSPESKVIDWDLSEFQLAEIEEA